MFVMLSVHSLSSIGEDLQRAAQQPSQNENKQRPTTIRRGFTFIPDCPRVLWNRRPKARSHDDDGETPSKDTTKQQGAKSWEQRRIRSSQQKLNQQQQQQQLPDGGKRTWRRSSGNSSWSIGEELNNTSLQSKTVAKSSLSGAFASVKERQHDPPPPLPQPPPVVATILNDLSPVPKVTNQNRSFAAGSSASTNPASASHMSPPMNLKGWHSKSPDAKAMRYYRLWIYTCNAVLLLAVIVFCGVAGKILLADYKRSLVNGLNLTQPSFVYAYFALLIQSGFIQLIGCFGALRLSEKLLNTYWLLLLLLLIGDALLGVFWMFKFEYILNDLQRSLKIRFNTEYGVVSDFTELWDRLQVEESCCGVLGPHDYSMHLNRSYPGSCCGPDVITTIDASVVARKPYASPVLFRTTIHTNGSIPGSELLAVENKTMLVGDSGGGPPDKFNITTTMENSLSHILSIAAPAARQEVVRNITPLCHTMQLGCVERVASWLKSSADILFVLGYCVIAFLKLSFLGILRYEIREMIQKIKLLQTEMANALCSDSEPVNTTLAHYSSHPPNVTATANGNLRTDPKIVNRDRERNRLTAGNCEGEMESLLHHNDSMGCTGGGGGGGSGVCGGVCCKNTNNNNNNILKYNMKQKPLFMCPHQSLADRTDMQMNLPPGTTLYSTCSQSIAAVDDYAMLTKTGVGGGDYEMNEFDNKSANYKLLSTPTVTKI